MLRLRNRRNHAMPLVGLTVERSLPMARHIRKILFALIPLTFLLFQQSSSAALEGEACSPEPTDMIITYGSLITCSINPSGESDLFRFNGQSGESVIISAARESGDGTPCVNLSGPGGPLGGRGFERGCHRRPSSDGRLHGFLGRSDGKARKLSLKRRGKRESSLVRSACRPALFS